jgi:uncharacterized protein YbjT (DUF2867 family)
MRDTSGIILVIGATGRQGGSAARHLLGDGWTVRGLTRDPESAAARALADAGAEVVRGDMADAGSLDDAMRGVHGVFSVQGWRGPAGVEGEFVQGLAVAEAAARAHVAHFTYSSVGGVERATGIPHFESKWRIEQRIAELGLPATIWRPVSFIENFGFQRQGIEAGTLNVSVPEGTALQHVAVEDIGRFVALGFREPERFIGQATEIAGDELTPEQTAAAFAAALGHAVGVKEPDLEAVGLESAAMMRWFAEGGYEADIPALRRMLPGLLTLPDWIARTGWSASA